MSEPISALRGASSADGIARIAEAPLQGMITLRGDLSDTVVKAAVQTVTSVDIPQPGAMQMAGTFGLCWMSPDELLVLCPHAEVNSTLDALRGHLADVHAMAVNVSDARALFTVSGPHARDVMAKLSPVDLSQDAFQSGMFRRTRIAQVAAAFWLDGAEVFHVVCFRSQAQYVLDVLTVSARLGSGVFSDATLGG